MGVRGLQVSSPNHVVFFLVSSPHPEALWGPLHESHFVSKNLVWLKGMNRKKDTLITQEILRDLKAETRDKG
jgi:hypothetical protein